jgi:hypothetical protein
MIKNGKILKRFEDDLISQQRFSIEEAFNIVESLWHEGVSLGVLPPKNPMYGIEVDIKIVKALNSCLKT